MAFDHLIYLPAIDHLLVVVKGTVRRTSAGQFKYTHPIGTGHRQEGSPFVRHQQFGFEEQRPKWQQFLQRQNSIKLKRNVISRRLKLYTKFITKSEYYYKDICILKSFNFQVCNNHLLQLTKLNLFLIKNFPFLRFCDGIINKERKKRPAKFTTSEQYLKIHLFAIYSRPINRFYHGICINTENGK